MLPCAEGAIASRAARKSRPRSVSSPEIRRAVAGEAERLADSLARAFTDDPGFAHLLLDSADRTERLRVFFETELREIALPRGLVWTTEEVIGAAVWAEPGQWRVPVGTTLRELRPMTRVFGGRLPIALWSRLRMDARHPRRPAHWYLAMMGVVPEWQGRGLGSALMRPGLEEIDAARLPAYLETSTLRARALYERNGFAVTGELNLPAGGPPIWLMWREAQRAG
ncbi:MAG TPA: GNAT family N-acetyltransferase [Solirubrobacterales bacterium]|nr:GNAT family N-acetyltransferase [Solirubrobacterales bacterium]